MISTIEMYMARNLVTNLYVPQIDLILNTIKNTLITAVKKQLPYDSAKTYYFNLNGENICTSKVVLLSNFIYTPLNIREELTTINKYPKSWDMQEILHVSDKEQNNLILQRKTLENFTNIITKTLKNFYTIVRPLQYFEEFLDLFVDNEYCLNLFIKNKYYGLCSDKGLPDYADENIIEQRKIDILNSKEYSELLKIIKKEKLKLSLLKQVKETDNE